MLIALLIGSLWFLSFNKISQKKEAYSKFESIPKIELHTSQNEIFYLTDFSYDEVKLLIYFNTHCDFCQFEMEELSKRLPEFENTEIILVSAESIDSIKFFMQTLGFYSYPSAGAYHCPYDTLNKYFGQLSAPTTFVYNTKNKLIKRLDGAARIDDLLQVVQTVQANKSTRNE
ncbi:MAG: peroxiredoxin family protein [Prolixibacteraceae bacterium]|nr:peroxiredoxin family protein [Prolixibacteraceae bacterium]